MSEAIPNHLGIILDGNRRWATKNNLPLLEGHKKGAQVFEELALHAFNRGVKFVTGYVFSTENWQRTDEEVGYLMALVSKAVEDYLDVFHKEGIRIVILGRRDGLRSKVLKAITRAEETTADNTKGMLALCFNYGGQEEIVDSVNSMIAEGVREISKKDIEDNLYGPDLPNVDLLIRTSGEQRTSGFMLWRSPYAELYFSDVLWPDFTTSDLDNAFVSYSNRERRFGN